MTDRASSPAVRQGQFGHLFVGSVALLLAALLLAGGLAASDRAGAATAIALGAALLVGVPAILVALQVERQEVQPAQALRLYLASGTAGPPPSLPGAWSAAREHLALLVEAQAQLKGFFDHLPTSIYLKRIDDTVVQVSRHLAARYGMQPEDMVGRPEQELHVEGMKPQLARMDRRILKTGEAIIAEATHLQFDRRELVSRFPVFNDQGEITHIGGMNFDIDDRHKAQAALEETKALFEAFIQHAPNPMVLLTPEGRYVMINDATARYYNETPEALLAGGAKAVNARFPEAATVILPMFQRVVATCTADQVHTCFHMPSGERRDVAFAFFPILAADGSLSFIGNISYDLTEERRAQAALAASTEALHQTEKLAALGSMLAGVSHELNNPLAAVIGQAALLGEDLSGTEHADRIAKIRRAADRCARIVQSFLAMARRKAPDYRPVSVNDQVRAALELTEYQLQAASITVTATLNARLPTINADPDQLHQVIVNLLTNARQALEEGTGERQITITTARAGAAVTLTISDNGHGIDAETRERIFDPFFTTKAPGVGTGIGLSYSLGIIEAHGGTLRTAATRRGTSLVITLPVPGEVAVAASPETDSKPGTSGRALVIDDESDITETLAEMLRRLGLEVVVALGGRAGQAAMANNAPFDLVLSDMRMPDCDGPSLFEWMTTNRPDLTARIAFVTGDTMSGSAGQFLATVHCPVLEKPFTPDALAALVTAMMAG